MILCFCHMLRLHNKIGTRGCHAECFPESICETTHDPPLLSSAVSEAPIVMGTDQAALLRPMAGKRGEAEPEESLRQPGFGAGDRELNRHWFEANSGQEVTDVQKHLRHPSLPWMTLDGRVRSSGAVFEAKFMLLGSFTEGAAVEKYAPQLPAQHVGSRRMGCRALDHNRRR